MLQSRTPPGTVAGWRRHDERGLSESVQWAVLTPLVLLAVLGIIQAGIMLHGRSVAANAALAGAEAQAVAGAGQGVGERVARTVAEQGGLQGVSVTVGDEGGELVVGVEGRVSSVLPDGLTHVAARAAMPREMP